ncbi:MAG TPA: DUF6286 domain-containing protein [Pseudonocardiaceae bacterium]|nr:DUF6286 domain-containing protein [Pseudonocardiaceae bacterium]
MRILLRVLSPMLGLAVAAVGGFVAVEVVWAWLRPFDGPLVLPWPAWQATLQEWTWTSIPVRLAAAGLIVAGLLLGMVALRAGRREVRLIDPAPEITVITSPRSLARLVGHQVRELDHVASASVTATARKISVRAASRQPADTATLGITETVHTLLSELPLLHTPRVSVVVRPTEKPA